MTVSSASARVDGYMSVVSDGRGHIAYLRSRRRCQDV